MLLCGCGGERYYWYKEGATLGEADRVCTECYNQANARILTETLHDQREARVTGRPYIPEIENRSMSFESIYFENCMKAAGYRETPGWRLEPWVRKRTCRPVIENRYDIAGE